MMAATEDLLEADFKDGRIPQVGDKFGIGRR
jgi:hypothetical protein